MSERLPTQIGRFHVQSELGRGGFGRVFKAFDPTVSRLVAIKVLTEGGKDILTRFRNEATVAGNLRHENVVTVYEYGEHEGKPFLAMEFLEGEDLQQVINSQRPLSLLQTCQIMSQVAEGLHCAHRNGVIHRDVKPANIMVLPDGRVKIMDFGIARILRDAKATRLTQEGHMLGTLLYMAPEQFRSATTDVLCDIFAYGVIFYELIAGRHPFAAADPHVLMFKISFEEPPLLRKVNPDLPEALQRIIQRLLHKDRELRYQSLKEVQFDIGPILLDLRHQQAAHLLGQAQEFYASGELEEALSLVPEILSLDPADKVARALWENLQQQLRLRTLQPRIDALLKKGNEQLEQRRFEDAVQTFEAAQRLDPENGTIQGRIKQSRGHLERAQKVAVLLLASQRDFERQDYAGAYKTLSEALQHDPQNIEAAAALDKVKSAMEHRQREQHLDEALAKAGLLLALRSYDEALAVLKALNSDAGNPKVSRLLESARAGKESSERKQRLQGEIATINELLRDSRFEEALEKLQILKAEFQENEEVGQLEAYAQRELAARQRARWVETIAGQAGALLDASEFERALEVIDQGLRKCPGDSALIRLLGGAIAAKADWECRQAVRTTLDNCAQLRAQERFAEAIEVVEAALRQYSGEASLHDALHELERELASQQRIQAIQSACAEAQKLLERKQPGKAAQFIRQALVRYPDEAALAEVLEEAQGAIRERERTRALEAIVNEAAACRAKNDFAGVRGVLARGLEAWPGESVLLRQQEAARAAQAAFEREQAIHEMARRCAALDAENQLLPAVALVNEALAQYPGAESLEQLKGQLEARQNEVQRREAVHRIAEEAQAMLAAGRFEDAVELLEENLRAYSGEADLQAVLSRARDELRLRERATAIEKVIADVRSFVAVQEFDRAQATLDRGIADYSADPALVQESQGLRAAKATWERQQAIDEAVRRATDWASQKRYTDAIRMIHWSLEKYDNDPALREIQHTIESEWAEYKRRDAVAKAAADGCALLDKSQLDDALKLLQDACARFPGEAELERLLSRSLHEAEVRRRAMAIASAAGEARAEATRRNFASALEILRQALQAWPDEASLLSVQAGVQREEAIWRREQAVLQAVRDCEQMAGEGELDEALRIAGEALEQFPGDARLLEVRQSGVRALEARRRTQALNDALRRIESAERDSHLTVALELVAQALDEFGDEPPLLQTRQRLRARLREEELCQSRLRDIEALCRMEATARACEPARALEILKPARQIAARYPGDAEIKAASAPPLEQIEAIQKAQREFAAHNFSAALDECRKQLAKYPDHAAFLAIHTDAETAQMAVFFEDLRRRIAAELNLEARVSLLQNALQRYPFDGWAEGELRATLTNLALAQDIAEKAQAHENAGSWTEAFEQWNRLAGAYKAYPGLDAAIDRVRRRQEETRHESEMRWVNQVEAQLQAGDLGKAAALLSLAEVECPGSALLLEVHRRLDQAQEGRCHVRDLLARGEAECEHGRYHEARLTFHQAYTSEHADAAARKALLNALVRHAGAAMDKDWRAAEVLAGEARTLDPNFPLLAKLDNSIAGRKKEEIVRACLARAEQLQRDGDPLNASAEVESGLSAYPDESRLRRLRDSLSGRARQFREALNRELEQIRHDAQAAADPDTLEPLRQRAQAIADRYRDPGINASAEAAVCTLSARARELAEMQWRARAAVLRKRVLRVGGLAAALAAGVAGLRVLMQPPHLVPLTVTSSPSGAAVKIGHEKCAFPSCVFKLKPGTYTIEARRDGYRPAVQRVAVDAVRNEPIHLALEPLHPQIQISTNFASGTVDLDGSSAGELRNGQLTLRDLAFGEHRLAVTSPDGRATIALEMPAGQLSTVKGKLEVADAEAIVVSNLGSHARVECNCGSGIVTVDGKPAGELSSDGLYLHTLAEGNKTLQVGEHALVVSIQPAPVLNLFLASNRNIGTLVIDTNVENPTVIIDEKRYPGMASQGLIRIPLNVARYTVSLQKNGYRNAAPQTVQIQKGGSEKLVIHLDPMNATFQIRGAQPGTQVLLDGKPAGVVSTDERFTLEVATGEHTIELIRQGYASKRIVRRFQPGQTVEIPGTEAVLSPDQNALEEARRKAEQAVWDVVRKDDRAALQQYLDQHANGRFAQEASNLINKLDHAEKQRADQQKREEDQRKVRQAEEQRKTMETQRKSTLDEEQRKKAAEAAALRQQQEEAQQRATAEKQAVLEVLTRYAAAYRNRDAGAVKAVFPEVPKFNTIVNSFKIFRSYELTLDPAEPQITGDTAIVRCQRTVKVADEHRTQPPRSDAVTFHLQKTAGRWVIASIQ